MRNLETPTISSDDHPCPAGDGDWWQNTGGRKWKGGRQPSASVNFITAHDGFALADLVAYNKKHNEANGEGNKCDLSCPSVTNCSSQR